MREYNEEQVTVAYADPWSRGKSCSRRAIEEEREGRRDLRKTKTVEAEPKSGSPHHTSLAMMGRGIEGLHEKAGERGDCAAPLRERGRGNKAQE